MATPTSIDRMTRAEKVRDALWRYAPERADRWATVAVVAGVALAGVANWIRQGGPRP